MPSSGFDARKYWEQRLADDYSLTGVGFRRLGPSFNRWAYRVRGARFDAAVHRLDLELPDFKAVDVGSGTGFYVDRWLRLGARVTGLDLTDTAIDNLRMAYPEADFLRADIADRAVVGQVGAGTADVVSAMDVLFHIVDDEAFMAAVTNIRDLLRPGGYLLYSDIFLHGPTQRVAHRVTRPLTQIERRMDDAGLEIVERKPFFFLMNDPLDARSRVLRAAWYGAAALVSSSDRVGQFVGRRVYPLELRLTERRAESPTTELMVCRRR
jgi:2-polyprenyl-3-methyl-5-hydroxy-6-metoxy-1,4-benzoquinol methylase